MKLIKLTEIYRTNEFVDRYLNVDEIGSFKKEKTNNYTMLFVKHDIVCEVKETPEEIIELIKQAKEI